MDSIIILCCCGTRFIMDEKRNSDAKDEGSNVDKTKCDKADGNINNAKECKFLEEDSKTLRKDGVNLNEFSRGKKSEQAAKALGNQGLGDIKSVNMLGAGLKVKAGEEIRRRASTGEMREEGEKATEKCMARRGSARKDMDTLQPSYYIPMR